MHKSFQILKIAPSFGTVRDLSVVRDGELDSLVLKWPLCGIVLFNLDNCQITDEQV